MGGRKMAEMTKTVKPVANIKSNIRTAVIADHKTEAAGKPEETRKIEVVKLTSATKKTETKATKTEKKPAAKKTVKSKEPKAAEKKVEKAVEKKVEAESVKKIAENKENEQPKVSVVLEFGGRSISDETFIQNAKNVWQYDLGKNVEDLKDLKLYVKPEEGKVYYVANEESGSFDL